MQRLEYWRNKCCLVEIFFCTWYSKWNRTDDFAKGQLNSEWSYEIIISPKMPKKNYKDICPGSLLEGRAEILKIFGWYFGRNDDLINSFWI